MPAFLTPSPDPQECMGDRERLWLHTSQNEGKEEEEKERKRGRERGGEREREGD